VGGSKPIACEYCQRDVLFYQQKGGRLQGKLVIGSPGAFKLLILESFILIIVAFVGAWSNRHEKDSP
jgi:hypothetical protein